jgi:Fe-coproporphyrin III synthase
MIKEKLQSFNHRYYPGHLFHAPQWLVLGVNNICNLHCKMCDVGTGTTGTNFSDNLVGTRPLHMPLELIKLVIDQAHRYYPKTKLGYGFTEPLAYTHLLESLDYANQKKLYTSVTTNALNLKTYADGLCKAGLDDIYISLDGLEETHNAIRGHKSSFQRAIEGIELLLAQPGRPGISIFCVITEWNITELKSFADYFSKFPLKQLGFMHMNFTPADVAEKHNQLYGASYPATASNIDQINTGSINLQLLQQQIEAIKKSQYKFPVTFSPDLDTMPQLETFYQHPGIIIGKRCNDAFSNIMIKSDGSVIPAHGRCYNLTTGNLYESTLKEIWNSAVAAKFRKDLIKAGGLLPACARCCSAF